MTKAAIGIDFGTTNSSIARVNDKGEVRLAHFPYMGEMTASYRSLLYLEQMKERGVNTLKSWSGPEGIEHYLSADRHHLSFLRAKDIMDLLTRIKTDAVEPHKIAALIHLIKEDLGYQLQ